MDSWLAYTFHVSFAVWDIVSALLVSATYNEVSISSALVIMLLQRVSHPIDSIYAPRVCQTYPSLIMDGVAQYARSFAFQTLLENIIAGGHGSSLSDRDILDQLDTKRTRSGGRSRTVHRY